MMRTGAQIEDHAAAMARRFGELGILADPGRFGGVVLYPNETQAEALLALAELRSRAGAETAAQFGELMRQWARQLELSEIPLNGDGS
jgi:hypothetical protein